MMVSGWMMMSGRMMVSSKMTVSGRSCEKMENWGSVG